MNSNDIHDLYTHYNSYPMSYDDMDTFPNVFEDMLGISAADKQAIRERSWYEFDYKPNHG